jgi:hypothetical protein
MEEAKDDQSQANPGVRNVLTMLSAYHDGDAQTFNTTATDYANWLDARAPQVANKLNFELIFNHVQPFLNAIALYVLVFLLVCFSWLFWRPSLQRTAF